MPGAMPLPSGALGRRGAFGARDAFDAFRVVAEARGLRRGAAFRAVFRAVFRRTAFVDRFGVM
jgi:hypothetical protein